MESHVTVSSQLVSSIIGAKLYLVADFKLKFKALLNNILFYYYLHILL